MDGQRFDALATAVARGKPRRALLSGFAAVLGGLAVSRTGLSRQGGSGRFRTYVSPNYGYSVIYINSWCDETLSAHPAFADPANSLLLRQVDSPAANEMLSFVPHEDFDGEPARCVAELDARFLQAVDDDPALRDAEPLLGTDGRPVQGSDETHAYGAYAYVRDESPVVTYTECRKLVLGRAVLAIAHTTHADWYKRSVPSRQAVLSKLVIPDLSGDSSPTPGPTPTAAPRPTCRPRAVPTSPVSGCPAGWRTCGGECYNPDTHTCVVR